MGFSTRNEIWDYYIATCTCMAFWTFEFQNNELDLISESKVIPILPQPCTTFCHCFFPCMEMYNGNGGARILVLIVDLPHCTPFPGGWWPDSQKNFKCVFLKTPFPTKIVFSTLHSHNCYYRNFNPLRVLPQTLHPDPIGAQIRQIAGLDQRGTTGIPVP